ncbi:MAG: anthranilate synthase, amidotransferase component [Bacteroidetes bacterium]|nr:anthranilate synthase, amidotransferase component [Bacteroidota bacterium]
MKNNIHNRLLILDNYDSFTYNLVHLVEKVSEIPFDVVRNDKISIDEINNYSKILLSPGPGLPADAGIMPDLIKVYCKTKSILGVCLGMQAIGEAFGSELKNLDSVFHGVATPVNVVGEHTVFNNCPKRFNVGRYHSWVVNSKNLSSDLLITSMDDENNIMSLRHKSYDVGGVQFHPESILSEYGEQMLKNWMHN